MVGLSLYEGYPSMWDMLTTAITKNNADEQKLMKSELKFIKNGQRVGNMFGY